MDLCRVFLYSSDANIEIMEVTGHRLQKKVGRRRKMLKHAGHGGLLPLFHYSGCVVGYGEDFGLISI